MSEEIKNLTTEMRNPESFSLSEMNSFQIVELMNREDEKVNIAIKRILPEISKCIDKVVEKLRLGGRLVYVGSGTSGRLGVLDAVESYPTFGVDDSTVTSVISGGYGAIQRAEEGVEDNRKQAVTDLKEINLNKKDVLIGIAASGRTPYVLSALEYAKELGCLTASISCNENSEMGKISDYTMEAVVGPEILTGSTRLKAGTAQKIILNMISTASMVGLGKVYENFMVDLVPSNEKLFERAENIIIETCKVTREEAKKVLEKNENNVKLSIFSLKTNLDLSERKNILRKNGGHLKKALEEAINANKVN